MSEEINLVKVFQDAVGEWWLEFYANDVRHQVTIEDVMNGLASFVNMQETNAVLRERIDDLESAQQSVHPTGGTHSQLVSMVNSLANIIIEASGKDGYLSSNDLDYANDCLDKVIPLLKPTSG